MKMLFPLLAGALLLASQTRAHYLWIESERPNEARVYFGEYNEGAREKAGGRLDERETLTGWVQPGTPSKSALSFSKKADHFFAKPGRSSGWLLVQDVESEVKDWTKSDIGVVKPMFYARAAIANHPGKAPKPEPVLPLDILPGEDPHEFQVFFNGKPLPNAKVLVAAPNQWVQELRADADGHLKIKTPWPGRYVLDVIHKERVPGSFRGVPYEATRHRVTFTHVY